MKVYPISAAERLQCLRWVIRDLYNYLRFRLIWPSGEKYYHWLLLGAAFSWRWFYTGKVEIPDAKQ